MNFEKLPNSDLPADLPEDWKMNDAVTPSGTDAGLSEKHGYNYLMKAVNTVHRKMNELIKSLKDGLHVIAYSGSYNDLKDKPSAYPPSNHVHTPAQVGLNEVTNDAQIKRTEMGSANGVATLDNKGTLPVEQIPTSLLSDDNLLINGDFTIWQRGKRFSDAVSGKYTVDCWAAYADEKVTKVNVRENAGRLLVDGDGTSNYAIHQRLNLDDSLIERMKLYNRKMCFSFYVFSSVNVEFSSTLKLMHKTDKGLDTALGRITTHTVANKGITVSCDCTIPADVDFSQFKGLQFLLCYVNQGITDTLYFDWAKVGWGKVAKPCVPRPYAQELALCQHNQVVIGDDIEYITFGNFIIYNNRLIITLINPIKNMRSAPTISLLGFAGMSLFAIAGKTNIAILDAPKIAYDVGGSLAIYNNYGLSNGTTGMIQCAPKTKILIDANIY